MFTLNGSIVDIVQSYCYLGIIFSASGTFNKACEALTSKALKAFYKFKQIHPNNNVPLALKLFDTLVSPIASYCGAIWGVLCTGNNVDIYDLNFYDKAPLEKINLKLCKYLLGVNKYSCNHAVRGELGRYPLLINVLDMCSKFRRRIFTLSDNTLVKLSCIDINSCISNKDVYDPTVRKALWQSRVDHLSHISADSKMILQNIYSCLWSDVISNQTCDDKLRTYAKFKSEFEIENYVISVPFHRRKMFTRLRISAHQLAIEKGRHKNLPKKADIKCDFCCLVKENCTCNRFKYHRLCHCCNVVEDEIHFLLKCTIYDQARSDFFNKLRGLFTFNLSQDDAQCFITLMNNLYGDPELAPLVCDFVDKCFDLRKKYLEPFEIQNVQELRRATCTRYGRLAKQPDRLIESIG